MKILSNACFALSSLVLVTALGGAPSAAYALPQLDQGNPGGPGGSAGGTGGGAGGSNTGPGDTVPGGTRGGNPASGGVRPPVAGAPVAPAPPGYGPGASPLAPRIPPPGLDYPGSPNSTPPPVTPSSPPTVDNPNSWQTWWHYNRWAHLQANGVATSGGDGFYLGHGEKPQTSPLLRVSRNQMRNIVVPALTSGLVRGGSHDFAVYSLHALAKLRGIEAPEGLAKFDEVARSIIRNGSQLTAEKAVLALGIRGEDRFVPWLTSILADTQAGRELTGRSKIGHRLRAFAAYGLGLLGDRTQDPEVKLKIMAALSESLAVERDEVQAACIFALGLTPLSLPSDAPDGVLAGLTRVDQVMHLLNFFENDEASFLARSQVPNALARLVEGVPESLRSRVAYALLTASGIHSKERREVQNAAVIALGKVGRSGPEPIDQEIRSHLEKLFSKSGGDRSIRYLATIALAEAASRPGTGEEPLAGLAPTRRTLLRSLDRSRGETLAWTALAVGVLEEDAALRGGVADPASGKSLRQHFARSRSAEATSAIAIALGMMRDQEAGDILLEHMQTTGNAGTRSYSALALGMIGFPGAIGPIRNVLTVSTNQPRIVENAAIALSLLGDQETGSILFSILKKSANPRIQASVASAMGWIKDPRPLLELTQLISDSRRNDTARAWTAVCIGRICDTDDWPWVGRLSVDVLYDVFLPTLIEPTYQSGLLDLP